MDEEQDAFDLALATHALSRGLPVLAICRGLQVVNVSRGGTTVQDMDDADLPEAAGLKGHRNHRHQITIEEGSRLHSVVGGTVQASCYHHQCLAELGTGMRAVARSEEGVVEGVEIPDAAGWFLGLQWHPEDTWGADPTQLAIFSAFVRACGGDEAVSAA